MQASNGPSLALAAGLRRPLAAVLATLALLSMTVATAPGAGAGPVTQTLTVTKEGNGGGTVTSTPPGIDCGPTCESDFPTGTPVDLTADPGVNSDFAGWGGDCSGTGICAVIMDAPHSVTATFVLETRTLQVDMAGNGAGTVTSSPAGIDCGSDCTQNYNHGAEVTLAAEAAASSVFEGWTGGGCSGTGDCVVTMDADRNVTATFTLKIRSLQVDKDGNGFGTVTGTPGNIDCGSTCSRNYNHGTEVTLTADPTVNSIFEGWTGGGCSGTGDCVVSMTVDRNVTATFTLRLRGLSVTRAGNGAGNVTSAPAGISCGTDCSQNYNHGADVTLTADPNVSSVFTGWTGDCSGTGNCDLTMNAGASVTATFTLRRMTLRVGKQGNGSGSITSTPAGISCKSACDERSADFNYNATVTLRAFPKLGSAFVGWHGACQGKGACVVHMTAGRHVSATFSTVCGRIAFVSTRSGNEDLFTMDADGARGINITKNPAADNEVVWSPNCARVAFTSDRSGNPDIYVMNADGTGVRRVTTSPSDDSQPTWAPGGLRLAFTRTTGSVGDLYVIDVDGTHLRQLTSSPADDFRPDWSPGGRRILFVSSRSGTEQLYTIAAGGGHLRQLTHSGGQNLQPVFSPNGRRIAFVSTRDGNRELYLIKASGSGAFQLTRSPGVDAHPSWSPHGARIAFYTTRAGNDEIFRINPNGTHAANISRNPASDTGPVWSS